MIESSINLQTLYTNHFRGENYTKIIGKYIYSISAHQKYSFLHKCYESHRFDNLPFLLCNVHLSVIISHDEHTTSLANLHQQLSCHACCNKMVGVLCIIIIHESNCGHILHLINCYPSVCATHFQGFVFGR